MACDCGDIGLLGRVVRKTRWSLMQYALPLALVFILIRFGYANAVAECMSGNKVKCFDCNSHQDPYCADPFNWTTLPPVKLCNGCCVKIVQDIDTPEKKIRRSCTDALDINLFIVDHVCMSEGGGKGRMCFCERNECNSATTFHGVITPTIITTSIAFLFN